jgi:hypothetical protein
LAAFHDIWRLSFLQRSVCYDYGVGSSAAFLGPVMRTVSFLFDFSASVNRIMDKSIIQMKAIKIRSTYQNLLHFPLAVMRIYPSSSQDQQKQRV